MDEYVTNEGIKLLQSKYGALIKKIAFGVLRDEFLAEDVNQEVMSVISLKYSDIMSLPPNELKNFLCTITRNNAIDMYRKQKRATDAEMENMRFAEMSMDHIDKAAFHNQYGFGEEIQELLHMLDYLDKDIIYLYYGEGYNIREIGEILGKPLELIKKRLYRAKIKLKSILVDGNGGDQNE